MKAGIEGCLHKIQFLYGDKISSLKFNYKGLNHSGILMALAATVYIVVSENASESSGERFCMLMNLKPKNRILICTVFLQLVKTISFSP